MKKLPCFVGSKDMVLCSQESANRPYRELDLCSMELSRRFLKYLLNITFSSNSRSTSVLFLLWILYLMPATWPVYLIMLHLLTLKFCRQQYNMQHLQFPPHSSYSLSVKQKLLLRDLTNSTIIVTTISTTGESGFYSRQRQRFYSSPHSPHRFVAPLGLLFTG